MTSSASVGENIMQREVLDVAVGIIVQIPNKMRLLHPVAPVSVVCCHKIQQCADLLLSSFTPHRAHAEPWAWHPGLSADWSRVRRWSFADQTAKERTDRRAVGRWGPGERRQEAVR